MVCAYHDQQMLAELVYLRAGASFEDLASDLLGYAEIYRDHSKQLKEAGKHYRAEDAKRARELAEITLRSLAEHGAKEVAEWQMFQKRALKFMVECNNEVRGAGVFLWCRETTTDKLFPPLAMIRRRLQPR